MRLSVVISSDSRAIDLKKIAYLINQNKGTFSVAFSEAVVGELYLIVVMCMNRHGHMCL